MDLTTEKFLVWHIQGGLGKNVAATSLPKVPPNKTNRTRKALGVNALTKGTLGDKETISEIIFGRYV